MILGVSWTWYGDGTAKKPDGSLGPTLIDHGAGGTPLFPEVELSLPGLTAAPVADDGYSPFRTASGSPPQVDAEAPIHYQVRFKLPGADPGTILLSTPVADDVTLYVAEDDTFTYRSSPPSPPTATRSSSKPSPKEAAPTIRGAPSPAPTK